MMNIVENQSLKAFNTFGVDINSRYFFELREVSQLSDIAQLPKPHLFLGGGSNILFTKDYPGTVILNRLQGITILEETAESVLVKAMGGENWHLFVARLNEVGFHGMEYLALIPGTVGAAPVQNIGAYGAEVAQFIREVEVFDCEEGRLRVLTNEECDFSYRDSIFKQNRGRYFIISVTFELLKDAVPNVTYSALKAYLETEEKQAPLTMRDLFLAVIAVRSSKLPDPKVIGNGGSFFKNPVVEKAQAMSLLEKIPNLVMYPQPDNQVKLAAGQLIELAGFKGAYDERVGMYKSQALVLVNLGGATGQELWKHALKVQKGVESLFSISLEPEPLIL